MPRPRGADEGYILPRAAFLVLPIALVLASCGQAPVAGPESRDQEVALRAVIDAALTTKDASVCDRYMTERFLEQWAGQEAPEARSSCHKYAGGGAAADSIDIEALHIRGRRATARVATHGGGRDGITQIIAFVKRRGWRLDRITSVTFRDRGPVDESLIAQLTGAAAQEAKESDDPGDLEGLHQCFSARVKELTDAELESVIIKKTSTVLLRVGLECGLRAGVKVQKFPAKVGKCIVDDVMASLTEPRLERLSVMDDRRFDAFMAKLSRRAEQACTQRVGAGVG